MQFIQYVSSARLVNSTGAALQKYIIIPILFVHGSQHLVEGSSLKDKMLAALFPGHRTTACIYALMHTQSVTPPPAKLNAMPWLLYTKGRSKEVYLSNDQGNS